MGTASLARETALVMLFLCVARFRTGPVTSSRLRLPNLEPVIARDEAVHITCRLGSSAPLFERRGLGRTTGVHASSTNKKKGGGAQTSRVRRGGRAVVKRKQRGTDPEEEEDWLCVYVTLSGPVETTVGCFQHDLRSLRKSTAALARPHQCISLPLAGWRMEEGGLPGEFLKHDPTQKIAATETRSAAF
jgi:hypothetical protein